MVTGAPLDTPMNGKELPKLRSPETHPATMRTSRPMASPPEVRACSPITLPVDTRKLIDQELGASALAGGMAGVHPAVLVDPDHRTPSSRVVSLSSSARAAWRTREHGRQIIRFYGFHGLSFPESLLDDLASAPMRTQRSWPRSTGTTDPPN
jgi:hypothetical protein